MRMRWTQEGDLEGLSRLFEGGFGRSLSRAEWEWKYRRLPGEARSAVAVDDAGQVLAHAGVIGLPTAAVEEAPALLWQTVDFVASAQGGGLRPPVVPLMRWIIEDLPREQDAGWIIGFPSPRNRRLTERVLRSGWLRGIRRWQGSLERAADAAPAGAVAVELESGDSTLLPGAESADWAERCWQRCGGRGVRRSAAFLHWRYHGRPERYYRFYRLRSEGETGLAVAAFAGEQAALTELWLPPGADWRGALPVLAADLHAAGLRQWRLWSPPVGREWLAALEWEELDPIPVAYRGRVGQDLTEVVEAAQACHYSMGDYDFH